jgi:hypothetical protein
MHKQILYNMRNLLLILLTITILSCDRTKEASMTGAHGNAGNILLIIGNNTWESEIGDSLRAVFHQYCPALPMEEHLFSLHPIPKEKFIDQNRYHRNIIIPNISENIENPNITINKDKYAKRQLVVTISAPDQQSLANLIHQNKEKLIKLFLEEDRDRYLFYVNKHVNKTIAEMLRKKHEVIINIPRNYVVDINKDNFVWIAHETVRASIGIFVYHYPLTEESSLEADYLIKMRNEILKENVPGELPESYMTTEQKYYYPHVNIIQHKNKETAHIRGLWKVHGDFMGGPFVSYVKMDKARNRMVAVEGFIYNPHNELRDDIRRLDAVLFTFDLLK